ncbi:hypothetical protein LFZ92_11395 [Salmonella enterica subsp. salamae serovar 57:z29:z42]|uniref:ZirS family two-partner secretion-like system exoprotein n=1 Tax=Salmonella enterica TaxID=28901 RepID=UPI000B7BFFD4|nr:ZirS family two-partner secretion-like system exoprotein [Salmonella enterica]ASO10482.1 hypothetical protein LFZ92_11395 [Salmonella enterica subsp. salamae serovar 57:z29:z42]
MSKHNLIIYSLLMAAVPISVSADSSTTSAATVGMLSSPTVPSVGHRPSTPLSDYELILNGYGGFGEASIPIPGMRLYSIASGHKRDPDTDKYQANETATTVCTYYRIEKNDSRHELLHEKPCKYGIDIGEDDIGSKIRIEHYNETDVASASGYMPVPMVSELHSIETKRIVKLSSDLSVISADKSLLMPGESAVVKIIVKDINNNPITNLNLQCGHSPTGNWNSRCDIKAGGNPGEYIQTVTYNGGSNGELRLTYRYFGELIKDKFTITGIQKK